MPVIPTTVSILHEVAQERQRQVDIEGYTPDHDDVHDRGELALVAASHACRSVAALQYNEAQPGRACWAMRRNYGRLAAVRRRQKPRAAT